MTELQDFMLNTRMKEYSYSKVVQELKREDCSGEHYISELPSEDDVQKVLSDKGQVRFFVYTKEHIYLLHIECRHGVDMIDDKMEAWDDENWDLLIVPR